MAPSDVFAALVPVVDALGVLKVQHEALDRQYLVHWARDLGIADLLDKAWAEIAS